MLMSAGLPLPRRVWVHGWLLAQGERMSKSRGNFLEPGAVVAALGRDGARYVTLREVAFDKDTDVSWDSFVRRYNADLANDYGNLVNRTLSMTARYLEGRRPSPTEGVLGEAWVRAFERYANRLEACLLHEALDVLWGFVGEANRFVESQQPWSLAKSVKAGEEGSVARLDGVLGDLLEACRVISFAVAPFMPETAARAAEQLGYGYPYAPDGGGSPSLAEALRWGSAEGADGVIGSIAPLFPRLETVEATDA
jgi:methionyl-tRNA synthetase